MRSTPLPKLGCPEISQSTAAQAVLYAFVEAFRQDQPDRVEAESFRGKQFGRVPRAAYLIQGIVIQQHLQPFYSCPAPLLAAGDISSALWTEVTEASTHTMITQCSSLHSAFKDR